MAVITEMFALAFESAPPPSASDREARLYSLEITTDGRQEMRKRRASVMLSILAVDDVKASLFREMTGTNAQIQLGWLFICGPSMANGQKRWPRRT